MSDDMFDMFGGLIKSAKDMSITKREAKWPDCVKLMKSGWKDILYKKIQEGDSEFLLVTWEKDSVKIDIKLSFSDQCAWIKYLEGNKNDEQK